MERGPPLKGKDARCAQGTGGLRKARPPMRMRVVEGTCEDSLPMTEKRAQRGSVSGTAEVTGEMLTQREAAALLRVSPSYIRNSDCPKILLPGNGRRAKPVVRYRRNDILAWAESFAVTATHSQRRV